MEKLNELLEKHIEFKKYLEEFNEDLFNELSYEDLKEFKKKYAEVSNHKQFALTLSKLTTKKKKEEYPELNGVIYYPEIKEMDFLTEAQKLELDKILAVNFKKGKYIAETSSIWYGLTKYNKELSKKILKFLLEKEIVEEVCDIHCKKCSESQLITKEQIAEIHEFRALQNTEIELGQLTEEQIDRIEYFENNSVGYWYCYEECCEAENDILKLIEEKRYTFVYKNIKDKQTKYDNL